MGTSSLFCPLQICLPDAPGRSSSFPVVGTSTHYTQLCPNCLPVPVSSFRGQWSLMHRVHPTPGSTSVFHELTDRDSQGMQSTTVVLSSFFDLEIGLTLVGLYRLVKYWTRSILVGKRPLLMHPSLPSPDDLPCSVTVPNPSSSLGIPYGPNQ